MDFLLKRSSISLQWHYKTNCLGVLFLWNPPITNRLHFYTPIPQICKLLGLNTSARWDLKYDEALDSLTLAEGVWVNLLVKDLPYILILKRARKVDYRSMYMASVTSLVVLITFSRLSLPFIKEERLLLELEHQLRSRVMLPPLDRSSSAPHHS